MQGLVEGAALHTVCQSAACPNLGECWSRGTATFMLGGNLLHAQLRLLRRARPARPQPLDPEEPERVARGRRALGLRFAVVTAVARDDLAGRRRRAVRATRARDPRARPSCQVEVLIPDYKGREAALRTVLDAGPDVLNHNLETVERLHREVRPAGQLRALARAAAPRSASCGPRSRQERPHARARRARGRDRAGARDLLRRTAAALLTLGQYLRPSPSHLPVERWVDARGVRRPGGARALALGFAEVASGPLVRSSYRAEQLARGRKRLPRRTAPRQATR